MYTDQGDQLVGHMVGGYRVEQLLSKGRLSAVYFARHPVQNTPVAITAIIIPEDFSVRARNRFIRRFTSEAEALVELNHPNILPIYDFGEQLGYPYLVTPYVTDGSLAHVLKRQGRCAPSYALEVLEQIAAGMDYAHSQGIIHRSLKPANILLNGDEHHVRVAGFGLVSMLQLRGVRRVEHPYAHLLNLAGTFLGAPEYLAPEVVLGQQQVDARADIYALGIMLFELLSGKPPFTGSDSLAIALQHVKQPLPALRSVCPSAPPALDQVLARALAREPGQRFNSAGEFVAAYARALQRRLTYTAPAQAPRTRGAVTEYADDAGGEGQWQLRPPIVTGKVAALPARSSSGRIPVAPVRPAAVAWQDQPLSTSGRIPIPTGRVTREEEFSLPGTLPSPLPAMPPAPPMPVPATNNADLDSFAWWSGSAPEPLEKDSASANGKSAARAPRAEEAQRPLVLPGTADLGLNDASYLSRPRSSGPRRRKRGRRKVVAMLATGGVLAAGVGLYLYDPPVHRALADLLHLRFPGVANNTMPPAQNAMQPAQPTKTMQPGGNKKPQPTTGTGHKGTVVGNKTLAVNSAMAFTNPADGKASLLIHLPSGQFVAYERSCTHEGVAVNYDPNTHMLVCPLHFATFDPAKNATVISGPAPRPLPPVTIRVNADGTITSG